MPEYRPSIKKFQVEAQPSTLIPKKNFTPNLTSYQNYQPTLPLSALPTNITNVASFSKPSFIAESPVKNQVLSKNLDITPSNVSNISATRPFRSVFPSPTYVTRTRVDENLVQVEEDDQTSRSVSELSQYNNTNFSAQGQNA